MKKKILFLKLSAKIKCCNIFRLYGVIGIQLLFVPLAVSMETWKKIPGGSLVPRIRGWTGGLKLPVDPCSNARAA